MKIKNTENKELSSTDKENTSSAGLPDGWIRMTIIIREEHKKKLEALAFHGKVTIKEICESIFSDFFHDKDIPPIPKKNIDHIKDLFKKANPRK